MRRRGLRKVSLAKRGQARRRTVAALRRSAKRSNALSVARITRIVKKQVSEVNTSRRTVSNVMCGKVNGVQWLLGLQIASLTPNSAANNGIEIPQGTGDGCRVGNKITPIRAVFKMMINFLPYNATTHPEVDPVYFKYWVVSARRNVLARDLTDVLNWTSDFFNDGSTNTGMTGTIQDMILPINTDKYRVHKTGVKKLYNSYFTGTGGPGIGAGYGSNNDFKLCAMVKINYKKYLPKSIVYDDGNPTPSTKPLWIMWACMSANGGAMVAGNNPLDVTYTNDFKFRA